MKRLGLALFGLLLSGSVTAAQWQTPDHSIPIGRGAGQGFKSVLPCLANIPIVGMGVAADPVCGTVGVGGGGTGATTAAGARTNLGVTATGADTTYNFRANNLSDVANAATARSNLGIPALIREKLTAAREYFIKTSGSGGNDSSDGLTLGTAWATPQHAIDILRTNIDVAGQQVTFTTAAGTFPGLKCEGALVGVDTLKPPKFVGAGSASTVISAAGDVAVKTYGGCSLGLANLSVDGNYGLISANAGYIVILGDVLFGTATVAKMSALYSGMIEFSGDSSTSGNAPVFAECTLSGTIVAQGRTITFVGSPIFVDGLLSAKNLGACSFINITPVGGTGAGSKKYAASMNGVVNTAGSWTIPGAVAGTTATGGQFD